jgi:hypothetical protein
MSSKETVLEVKIRLEGEEVKRFLKIKEVLGLRNNSEVLRFLINEKYRDLSKS